MSRMEKEAPELRAATLAIRIKPRVKDALAEYAYKQRLSSSLVAEQAIEAFLKRRGVLK